jgi:hypothetical protein
VDAPKSKVTLPEDPACWTNSLPVE